MIRNFIKRWKRTYWYLEKVNGKFVVREATLSIFNHGRLTERLMYTSFEEADRVCRKCNYQLQLWEEEKHEI